MHRRVIGRIVGLSATLVLLTQSAFAGNPILDQIQMIKTSGLEAGSLLSASPTKFKGIKSRKGVDAAVAELATSAEEKKAFREAALAVVQGIEEGFAGSVYQDDASASLALGIVGLHSIASGVELSDEALLSAFGGMQRMLDTLAVREMADADKEFAGEKVLALYGIAGSLLGAVEDPKQKKQMRQVAGLLFTMVTGASVESVKSSAKGFSIRAVKLSPPAAAAESKPISSTAGLAPTFRSGLPSGWVQRDGWMIKTVPDGTTRTSGMVRLLPAVTPGKGVGDIIAELWDKNLPAEFVGRRGGIVYRRYVGNGVPAYYVVGQAREKGRESDTTFQLMLVDCDSHWQPIVTAQTYEDTGDFRAGVEMSARFSLSGSAKYLEEYLATISVPATSGKALFDKSAVVGDYGYGSGSSADYVNVYTGASSTSYVSYGGKLNLKVDGTFEFSYSGASSTYNSAAQFSGQKGSGTWTIQGDVLTLNYAKFQQFRNGIVDSYQLKEKKYRVGGSTIFSDGVKVIILKDRLDLPMNWINLSDRSDWYTTKK